ncbi:MAG: hypothetical protein VW985_07465, partial [Gammaproteobacteria bacterium]
MAKQRPYVASLVGLAALITSTTSISAEIEPGTILSASNIDQLQSMTLDGKVLGEMLTSSQERLIRDHGMQM